MKPYDLFNDITVEIIAFDSDKSDMLVWRCTEDQGFDWDEIKQRVVGHGYKMFEKRIIKVVNELYEIED
jgi:hypothetical protein